MLLNRVQAFERIDDDDQPYQTYELAAKCQRWVNHQYGNTAAVISLLFKLLKTHRRQLVSVLVVGPAPDICLNLLQEAKDRGIRMTMMMMGFKRNPAKLAAGWISKYPGAGVAEADFFEASLTDGTYDVVISSNFIHRLSEDHFNYYWDKAHRLAVLGTITTDWSRNIVSYAMSGTVVPLFAPASNIFRRELPVAIQRSYTPAELQDYFHRKKLKHFRVFTSWNILNRLIVTSSK